MSRDIDEFIGNKQKIPPFFYKTDTLMKKYPVKDFRNINELNSYEKDFNSYVKRVNDGVVFFFFQNFKLNLQRYICERKLNIAQHMCLAVFSLLLMKRSNHKGWPLM